MLAVTVNHSTLVAGVNRHSYHIYHSILCHPMIGRACLQGPSKPCSAGPVTLLTDAVADAVSHNASSLAGVTCTTTPGPTSSQPCMTSLQSSSATAQPLPRSLPGSRQCVNTLCFCQAEQHTTNLSDYQNPCTPCHTARTLQLRGPHLLSTHE